ncbi:hypothetical protein KXV22_003282 [Aspergillus fumigatus]|nr:hypothetical protein KXW29_003015 [Aspergillus fumigatus]KAH2877027.1 hypothetical protein KXW22_003781 [Aspergillus fumigatus]KAH3516147.1 hypothetical protein KXV55_000405 [Aspergillus fumigatus]KAH3570820.1 hypothetical protein KXV22_003282 [Aspergillus fumigatus]
MESQNIGPSPPGNSLAISEFEHDGLATQCEGDEDLELLHMGQNDNEPISPNLKAVMEKDKKSDRPQEARPAPLLLERPQSSGLDVAGSPSENPVHVEGHFFYNPLSLQQRTNPGSRKLQRVVVTAPKAMLAETLQWIHYTAREHKMVLRKQQATCDASPRLQEIQTITPTPWLPNRVILKRRPTNGKKVPSALRNMTLASNNGSSQLSEEDLFQLLINWMRVREENEISASNLQERMEADMFALTEENKSLKNHLETIDNQLQRSRCQSKIYGAQIENWKTKLAKFKGILNELWAEYRNLRNENLRLKDSKATLENERNEIESGIKDAKRQISQAAVLVKEKRTQLAESERKVESMTLALKNEEDKTAFVQTQLVEERRRSSILESYIHNNSRVQTKQLAIIRTEQQEMLNKLNSAFDRLDQSVNASQAANQTTLELTLEKTFPLLKELSEQLLSCRADIQQYKDTVHKIFSSVNMFDFKLNEGLERNFALNENVAHKVLEQLKLFENTNGCHMALLKQLGINEEQYNTVREMLEALEPSMQTISSSLTTLNEKGIDLTQHITHLEKSIFEAQNPAPTIDVCALFTENAALKDQKEQLSIRVRSAEENAKAKELETEKANCALLDVTAKMQEEMKRAQDFEAEVVNQRQKIISIEAKIREELNRASVIARDQAKARSEQQKHKMLREKAEAEKDMATIRESLAAVQASMAEKENEAKTQRHELESTILEREQQLRELEASRTQIATRMSEQEAELELLREAKVAALAQQKKISHQLAEVQGTIVELSDRLSSKDVEFKYVQKKLDTCQSNLLKREEELTQVKKKLCNADSARSKMETGKRKAKSEIHALLKRLQDSERWKRNIKAAITRPGDPPFDGPVAGTWDKLKDYLNSADNDNPGPDSQKTTVPTGLNVVSKGTVATSDKADGFELGTIDEQSRSSLHQLVKLNCLATETAGGHKNAREDQDKQKTVTFRAEKEGNRIEKRKFSATVDSTAEESASEDRLIKKPGRTMKRTYSKIQRSPSSNGVPKFPNESNASPASERSNRDTHTENQYTSNDKRARVSVAPSNSKPRGQGQGAGNYLERRTSPASLASGNSAEVADYAVSAILLAKKL